MARAYFHFDPDQPRDRLGRWTKTAGGLLHAAQGTVSVRDCFEIEKYRRRGHVAQVREQIRSESSEQGRVVTAKEQDDLELAWEEDGYEEAAALIDRVHRMPSEAKGVKLVPLTGLEYHTLAKNPNTLGETMIQQGVFGDIGKVLQVNLGPTAMGATGSKHVFLHENGHVLDYALARRHGLLSESLGGPVGLHWWKLRDAIQHSATFDRLARVKVDYQASDAEREDAAYLLQWDELFARAYHQFIAERTGCWSDPAVQGLTRGTLPRKWDDDDFKPIAAAMETVLKEEGLL